MAKKKNVKLVVKDTSLTSTNKGDEKNYFFKVLGVALNYISSIQEKGEAKRYLLELKKINSQFETVLGHYPQSIAIVDLPLKANKADKRKLESLLLKIEELYEIPENCKSLYDIYGEWLAQAVHGKRRSSSEEVGVFSDSILDVKPYHERIQKIMKNMGNKK